MMSSPSRTEPTDPAADPAIESAADRAAASATAEDREEIRRESGLSSPHRLFAPADGVFAISMTLLALDVRIPDGVPETGDAFREAATDHVGYATLIWLLLILDGRFSPFTPARSRAR